MPVYHSAFGTNLYYVFSRLFSAGWKGGVGENRQSESRCLKMVTLPPWVIKLFSAAGGGLDLRNWGALRQHTKKNCSPIEKETLAVQYQSLFYEISLKRDAYKSAI
ncbi:hypothetical protein MR942_08865 [bacterium]|nr:hypothetical protein [bacterium]